MGGGGKSSGQAARRRRGRGGSDTQKWHASWESVEDIQDALGVSREEAQDYWDAVNGGDDGGFTRGWDAVIRAYEQGKTVDEIMEMKAGWATTVQDIVDDKFNGDRDAYMKAVIKKADDCEKLIEKSPKWTGTELMRGYHDMSKEDMQKLMTPDVELNLNWGTASWTTDTQTAVETFAHGDYDPAHAFVAHCTGDRKGTSINGLSHFKDSEWEVLCSKGEAFKFVRSEVINGVTHAWYEVVKTDKDWSKKSKK